LAGICISNVALKGNNSIFSSLSVYFACSQGKNFGTFVFFPYVIPAYNQFFLVQDYSESKRVKLFCKLEYFESKKTTFIIILPPL